MSNKYQRVYPKSGRLLLDGGLNNKFERSIIEENESPDCANVVFTNGAVESRQGVDKLNNQSIGSFVGDGLYVRQSNTGAQTMIAFAGGTAWQWTGASFTTIASAQSVFTAGIRVAAAQQENHIFVGNGGAIPYKYNGTDWTRHGVYPPTATYHSAPTFTVTSAPTGTVFASGTTRSYKVLFVNSASVFSDVGPAVTHTVAANSAGNARLTSIPVAPQSWGVSARRIYRTSSGGSEYKLLTTLGDNTTVTYDDGIADAALGATAPTDNGVPPLYSVVVYHQNRLFMNDPSNPSYLWYTGLGEPYTVATTNFRIVGDDATDVIKTLSVYDNSILITCSMSQWVLYMPSTDPADWELVRLKSPFGSKSPFCLLNFKNKQLFAAVDGGKFVGFAAVQGDSVAPSAALLTVSTAGSDLVSDRIEPDMFNIQETYLGNISGLVFKNKAYITCTYGSGNTTNNRIYVMDFSMSNLKKSQKEAWVPWTGLNAAQFCIYEGALYYISSLADGFVYEVDAGVYNDEGSAIDAYFWTKEFSGYEQDFNNHKDFRYANILLEKLGSYYMDVTVRVDSDTGDGTEYQVNLSPGGSLWGVMVWGVDSWGGAVAQADVQLDLATLSGKRVQFKFSNQNTINQRFKVHGFNFAYNVKGKR